MSEDLEKVYKRCMEEPINKNYQDVLRFVSKQDKEVFNLLPLSNAEKEQLIIELYPDTYGKLLNTKSDKKISDNI